MIKLLLNISVVIILFSGCSTIKTVRKNNNTIIKDSLNSEQKFEFKYQFFEANRYFLQGKYDLAESLFNGCLKIDPYSSATHYKLASLYLIKKDYNIAEKHAEKAVLFNPDNIWYLYLAGSIYSQNNNIEKAKSTFNSLIFINPNEIDFYFNLADVYLKDNDIKGALKIYNNIEKKFGISEIVSLQKHKLYLAANNKKEALNELVNLSNVNPSNIEYKRLIAEFYIKINSIEDAKFTYNNILKKNSNDGY